MWVTINDVLQDYAGLIYVVMGVWVIWSYIRPLTAEGIVNRYMRQMETVTQQGNNEVIETFNRELNEEIAMLFRTGRSEWMQGLLWAEGMRNDGMELSYIKGYLLWDGEVCDFWQGFDDYIGYCEEREVMSNEVTESMGCPLDKGTDL